MKADFVRALLKGEDLETVKRRLNEIEYSRHSAMLDAISKDYQDANVILRGLKEDENSLAHRFSVEVLKDAQNQEDKKSEQLKSFEASRQRFEEEYLKKMKEQDELIAKENDIKRRRIAVSEHSFITRRK